MFLVRTKTFQAQLAPNVFVPTKNIEKKTTKREASLKRFKSMPARGPVKKISLFEFLKIYLYSYFVYSKNR